MQTTKAKARGCRSIRNLKDMVYLKDIVYLAAGKLDVRSSEREAVCISSRQHSEALILSVSDPVAALAATGRTLSAQS